MPPQIPMMSERLMKIHFTSPPENPVAFRMAMESSFS